MLFMGTIQPVQARKNGLKNDDDDDDDNLKLLLACMECK